MGKCFCLVGVMVFAFIGSIHAGLFIDDLPLDGQSKPSVFATRITPNPNYKPLM
jgi:hypothetical protein